MATAQRPPLPRPARLLELARQQLAPVIAAGTVRLLYEAMWDRGAADYARQRLAGITPTAMRAQVLWALIAHHDATAEPWPGDEPFTGPGRPIAVHATARRVAAGYTSSMHPALRHVRRELLQRPTLALAVAPEPGPWQALDLDRALSIIEHAATFHTAHGAAEAISTALTEVVPSTVAHRNQSRAHPARRAAGR